MLISCEDWHDAVNSALYPCLANSPLLGQILFQSNTVARMTTSKQYENLNRLSSIPSSNLASFNYAYNPANQRVRSTLRAETTMTLAWWLNIWRWAAGATSRNY